MTDKRKRIIVGVTGASGLPALRILVCRGRAVLFVV